MVRVDRAGETVLQRAAGWAHRAHNIPMTLDTRLAGERIIDRGAMLSGAILDRAALAPLGNLAATSPRKPAGTDSASSCTAPVLA